MVNDRNFFRLAMFGLLVTYPQYIPTLDSPQKTVCELEAMAHLVRSFFFPTVNWVCLKIG